jgi:hypothetical protein
MLQSGSNRKERETDTHTDAANRYGISVSRPIYLSHDMAQSLQYKLFNSAVSSKLTWQFIYSGVCRSGESGAHKQAVNTSLTHQ